jgi:hypothetical protein
LTEMAARGIIFAVESPQYKEVLSRQGRL